MKNLPSFFIGFFIGFILLAIILTISPKTVNYHKGYKQGQIDCLIGDVKYKTVKHKDHTVTWEKINKG